jgi:phage tail sheath protein FI
MVQVSYPGVYVVEVPSGVHTITGVSTSVAAFFGRSSRGPINKAVHILSQSDYERTFGVPHPLSDLAPSVRQFFDNGGSECYVVRLANDAKTANITLRNLADTQSVKNVLAVEAKFPGAAGNAIRLSIDYDTPNPDDTFNLIVAYEEGGAVIAQEAHTNLSMNPIAPRFAPSFVTQSSSLVIVSLHPDMGDPANPANPSNAINNPVNTPEGYSQSRLPLPTNVTPLKQAFNDLVAADKSQFEISVSESQWVLVDLSGVNLNAAGNVAQVADAIRDAINVALGAAVPGLQVTCSWNGLGGGTNLQVLRITSNSAPNTSVHVRRAQSNDIAAALMLGLDQGGIEEVRYANMRPVFTGSAYVGGVGATAFGAIADGINELARLLQSDVVSITLDGHVVDVDLVTTDPGGGDRWYQAPNASSDGVREKLQRIADAVTNDSGSAYTAKRWGYHLAFQRRTTGTINDTAAITSQASAVLGNGIISNVRQYTSGSAGTSSYQDGSGAIGLDGTFPQVADYLGSELLQTGFHALDSVDIFNLMVLPGDREVTEAQYRQLIGPASAYCENHRAFLLIDAPDSWTSPAGRPLAQASDVNTLRALVSSQDHTAVFYPKVSYSNRGVVTSIGPSGMIAGLISRIDSTRGVWKTPAGVEANLRGVLDVQVNLTDKENGVLNKLGVNCIRKFPAGFVDWGGRTLKGSDDLTSEWKYISVRRTALFLEESLYRGTKWVVFEPNDEPLWAQIRMNLNAFMIGLFRQGAFQGSSPDQAFYVKCDSETTTENDRNLGIVNIEVGFAPLKPAEFVVIRIKQIAPEMTS